MAMEVGAEIEAKLAVADPALLRALARRQQLGPYKLIPWGRVHLHSLYADTKGLVLARGGIALRFRRMTGSPRARPRWEATIKWAGQVDGDVHHRPEINIPLDEAPTFPLLLQNEILKAHLSAWLCGRRLVPLFVTDIVRQRRQLVRDSDQEGEGLAELALDEVEIRATPESEPLLRYCEIEIEKLAGSKEDVADSAEILKRELNLEPSPATKFGRAMALVHPQVKFGERPKIASRADERGDIVAARLAAAQLRRLRQSDPIIRLGRDAEGVHAMRVAIRRLRTLTAAFEQALPKDVAARLEAELEWLGDGLATARELDVEIERLQQFDTHAPPALRLALERLRLQLNQQRQEAGTAIVAIFDGARYRRLLLGLERIAERPRPAPGAPVLGAIAYESVRRSLKRLRRCAKQEESPSVETMHALRIRTKRLRYILEFVSDLAGKSIDRTLKELTGLQEVLGRYHDAIRATERIQGYVAHADARTDATQVLALGALLGAQLQAAEEERRRFAKIWRRWRKGKRHRHLKQVLDRLKRLTPPALLG